MSIRIGEFRTNKQGLRFEVISKEYRIKTETFYKVRFDNGYETIAGRKPIEKGSVKNKTHPHIFGVAYIGDIKHVKSYYNGLAYNKWYSMLSRCYNKKDIGNITYNDVKVCDEWLCFKSFLKDIETLDGFDSNKLSTGKLELDKDYNGDGKLYSKETCKFIDKSTNMKLQKHKMKEFIGISPDGKIYTSWNQSEFARKHKLTARTIGKVLTKQLKTHKGWTFKYK